MKKYKLLLKEDFTELIALEEIFDIFVKDVKRQNKTSGVTLGALEQGYFTRKDIAEFLGCSIPLVGQHFAYLQRVWSRVCKLQDMYQYKSFKTKKDFQEFLIEMLKYKESKK